MPYFDFFWTDEIIEHLAQHGISTDDFEQVVSHPVTRKRSRSSGRRAVWGYTWDQRYVFAVYEMIDEVTVLPVTAFETSE